MNQIQIRRRILEMVYERCREHPYHRVTPKEFRTELNIGLKDLHFNIIYLEEKGYLELQKPLEGSLFVGARITPKGIDLIENEYQLDLMFPIEKEDMIPTNVFEEFNLLNDAIMADGNMIKDLRELITENINEIQNELKKSEPSYSTIKGLLTKIKERSHEIGEKVTKILKNPTVTKILSNSARKELESI